MPEFQSKFTFKFNKFKHFTEFYPQILPFYHLNSAKLAKKQSNFAQTKNFQAFLTKFNKFKIKYFMLIIS